MEEKIITGPQGRLKYNANNVFPLNCHPIAAHDRLVQRARRMERIRLGRTGCEGGDEKRYVYNQVRELSVLWHNESSAILILGQFHGLALVDETRRLHL